MKKAQIQVGFNWIFIMIAGAGLLAIFLIIIANQTSSSEARTGITTAERFKTMLTAIEITEQTSKEIDTINTEIQTNCEEGQLKSGVKDGTYQATLGTTEIFIPEIIGDSKLITWTQNYEMPFPITTLLSVTDKKTQYLFINSSQTRKIYVQFPDEIDKRLIEQNELTTLNPEAYRTYVLMTESVQNLNIPNDIKLKTRIIEIRPDGSYPETGIIRILNFSSIQSSPGQPVEIPYTSQTMLNGMIISANPEIINCTLQNINQKTRIISQINMNRTKEIHKAYEDLNTYHRCTIFYEDTTIDTINKLVEYTRNYEQNYREIRDTAEIIQRINQNIERASCTELY